MDKNTQRFTVKFNNGYWKVFDNQEYIDVGIYDLNKEAVVAARSFNK